MTIAGGRNVPASLPDGCHDGDRVHIAVRPEKVAVDELQAGMVELEGTVTQRVYHGITTQLTIDLGGGAQLVALEQNTYTARSDDRWEPGTRVKVGWHPEHCIVLR